MPKREQKFRYLVPVSGKDSLCTAIVQREREPNLPYEYVFCDVRMELPETYRWLDEVERKLGINITRIGGNLEREMAIIGRLPSAVDRWCTLRTKITPYTEFIEKDQNSDVIYNYIGFRADEKDRIPKSGVERIADARGNVEVREVYPLIEAGVTVSDVYKIIESHGLSVPNFFWKRLYDAVYDKCGPSSQKFIDEMPQWTRAYMFSWRSRSNCMMCFYQRLYEWVGLLEHHPDLFGKAEELERTYGGAKSEYRIERFEGKLRNTTDDFHWHMGWPLPAIRKEANRIFERRVNDVYQMVVEGRQKPRLELDMLSTTSCGSYCGK